VIVPVFTRLHAVAAANTLGGIEENASRLAVSEPRRGNEIAVFYRQSFGGIYSHAASLSRVGEIPTAVGLSLKFCDRQQASDSLNYS
jgi:hypothetical protein